MTIKSAVLAATVCTLSAASAHAATTHVFGLSRDGPDATASSNNSFSLDSTVLTGDGDTLSGTFSGLYMSGLTVLDGEITGGAFTSASELERFKNGAGVCRDAECFSTDEPHTVDGATEGIFDYIEMAFSVGGDLVDVTLKGLTFGWIGEWVYATKDYGYEDTNGTYEIVLDAMDLGDDLGIGLGDIIAASGEVEPQDNFNSRGSVDLTAENLFDSIFGVKAGVGGSWKLLAVTVEYDSDLPPPPPPPEIPLPGAVWLLLGGLAGLGLVGRRERSGA